MECDICGHRSFERLAWVFAPRVPTFSGQVGICRKCGFVTQVPRPSQQVIKLVHDQWFRQIYDTGKLEQNAAKRLARWNVMWERIGNDFPKGVSSVLDVGAGDGNAIEFLKQRFPNLEAYAIERSVACQERLRETLGVEVLDIEIEEVWPSEIDQKFDLVIFRHTLEHLREPLQALRRIRRVLAPQGKAYIVVPNLIALKHGTPVRTDFFRPIHLHYFALETLETLALRSGLNSVRLEAEGEIWGLFESAPSVACEVASPNLYAKTRTLLDERLGESLILDWKRRLRAQAGALLRPLKANL